MSALLISSLLISSTLVVRVEDAPGVAKEDAEAVATALAAAIADRTGQEPTIDFHHLYPCTTEDRCTEAIRERTGASDIVFVKLLGALTKIRLLAEAIEVESGSRRNAQADLRRNPDTWSSALDGVALILFPDVQPPPVATGPGNPKNPSEVDLNPKVEPQAPELGASVEPEAEGTDPVPWIILGTSVAVGIAGTVVGALAQDARNTVEGPEYLGLTDEEISSKTDLAKNGGLAANIMWGLSAVGITASVLMLTDVL